MSYRLDDGSIEEVAELSHRPQAGPSLGVSFDGNWLLTAERDQEHSDLKLVENFR